MDVGKRVTQLRIAKGLTTTALAHKAGLAQSHLRDIELGNKNPTVETVTCDDDNIHLLREKYPEGLHFVVGDTHGECHTLKALIRKIELNN